MNNSDEPEDEVSRAYQRASDPEAGRPASATRAAILAEARAASLRRTPAANDSRYAWRAVAGVAVLGVAVLLWKQADRHVSSDLTVASTELDEKTLEAPEAEAPAAPPQVSADTMTVVNEPLAKAEQDADRTTALTRQAPLQERESKRAEESAANAIASVDAPAANSREMARTDAAPPLAAGARRQDASEHQQLLQREFPEIWSGERAANTVWVIMDAAGKVARKGVLSDADTLASVASPPGSWTIFQVNAASGTLLQLAVSYAN